MKAKNPSTWTGVKRTVSAKTCMQHRHCLHQSVRAQDVATKHHTDIQKNNGQYLACYKAP